MTRRWSALGFWVVAVTTVVVCGVVAVRTDPAPTADLSAHSFVVVMSPAVLAFLLLGGLLLLRRPEHAFGWLLTANAALIGVSGIPLQDAGTASLGYRIGVILFVWFGALSASIVALFPTGRPLPGRWVWVLRLLVAGAVVLSTGWILNVQAGPGRPVVTVLAVVASAAYAVGFFGSFAMLVARFARSSGVERAQLKWFLFGVSVACVLWFGPFKAWAGLGPVVVVATIVLAIFRYRLYDIDRVISRSASYAIVSGIVLVTFFAVVAATSSLLGSSNRMGVAAATLAAAALARPALRRVQVVVDRRFNRSRYDAQQTVLQFGERLQLEVDADEVLADLRGVVNAALQPALTTVTLVRTS